MNKVSTYYVQMNAYRAVEFIENIQTDELCHYVGESSEPSGNVQLSRKKHFSHPGTLHGREGWYKEREYYSREQSTAIDADD
jgi:hypothetical protein